MIDLYVSRLESAYVEALDNALAQICDDLPVLLEDKENTTLWRLSPYSDLAVHYELHYNGVKAASFSLAFDGRTVSAENLTYYCTNEKLKNLGREV